MDKINVSRIQDSFRCEQYAHLKWREKIVPVTEAVPLVIGTAWHAGMEALMKGGDLASADTAMADVLSPFIVHDLGKLPDKKQDELRDNEALLHLVLPHVWFPPEWEILQVESELSIDLAPFAPGLPSGQALLRGRPDAVVRWNGQLWHCQHKTASRSVYWPSYEGALARSFHEAAYIAMMANAFPGERIGGTLLMGLKKLSAKSAGLDPQAALHRAFIPTRREVVESAMRTLARRGTVILAEDLLFDSDVPLVPLQNRDACYGTFKNMPCPYLPVCDRGVAVDNPAYFKSHDPYASYGEEAVPE